MGKNLTIYFNDECLELIEAIEGKGTLINQLILDHFANDEENLRLKIDKAEMEFNQLRARLNVKIKHREMLAAKKLEVHKLSQEEQERQNRLAKHQMAWENSEITDEEYWAKFENGKFKD